MSEESEDKVWLQIDHEVIKLRVNCELRDLQSKIPPAQHGQFAGEEAYWLEMLRRQVDFVEQFLPKLYEIYSSEWTERKPADFYRVVYRRAVKQALTNAQTGFEKYVDVLTPKDLDGAPLLSVLPRFLTSSSCAPFYLRSAGSSGEFLEAPRRGAQCVVRRARGRRTGAPGRAVLASAALRH